MELTKIAQLNLNDRDKDDKLTSIMHGNFDAEF